MTEREMIMKILHRLRRNTTIWSQSDSSIEFSVGTPYFISIDFDKDGNVTRIETYE